MSTVTCIQGMLWSLKVLEFKCCIIKALTELENEDGL